MEVDGHCRKCGEWFDAHWHHFTDEAGQFMHPSCPRCKSLDVWIQGDEFDEIPEEDECDMPEEDD